MAKKTPARKPRRRLKRSVRRSLSAVLMITAIAVAAIPVPENYALPEDGQVINARAINDVHDAAMKNFEYNPKNADSVVDSWANANLNRYQVKDGQTAEVISNKIIEDYKAGDVFASMSIRDIDGDYMLSWQFMYYQVLNPNKDPRGVICKYNDEYIAKEIPLPLNPITEYYTIEGAVFESYFNNTIDAAQCSKLMDMAPDTQITYSYTQFCKNSLPEDDKKFFTDYFLSDFNAHENIFKSYAAYEADYNKKLEDYNNDPDNNPDPGTKEPEPSAFVRKPMDITADKDQMDFFSKHDKILQSMNAPYTLYSVRDARPGHTGTVYVAKDGQPRQGYYNDDNKFLVKSISDYSMCGIGAGAFKGVDKIETLNISDMIGYIGDEAFENANLIKEIHLNNVSFIGNRAFKNCKALNVLDIGEGTNIIGQECFYGTAVDTVELPSTITKIGYGAFANCNKLVNVLLNKVTKDCEMQGCAFYDCSSLQKVEMSEANIISIGEGAFAVTDGGVALSIVMPQAMSASDSIGDYMFVGRSSLKSVVFPRNYGSTNRPAKLPDNLFHQCSSLEYVEFPSDSNFQYACGGVTYTPKILFADVVNSDFYVKGPKMKNIAEPAAPRECTWDAETAVSKAVPYLYIENGVEYYEVSDGTYLLCIDNAGTLISCTFKPGLEESKKHNVNLVIPSKVGNTAVKGIASGCFSDSELNEETISLTIQDESITKIDNGVFKGGGGDNNKDWLKLHEVYIGNSVASIGDSAFEGCKALEEVTFSSPLAGHDAFTVGENAFKTGSEALTFHGDIVEGYDPFDWAMNPNNTIDGETMRVCYKSLAPTYLTVMYNPITDMVTLLDYPKADQISGILREAHKDELGAGQTYEEWRVASWYERFRNGEVNNNNRSRFAQLWKNAGSEEERKALYATEDYGPWINEEFCLKWEKWADGTLPGNTGGSDAGTSSNTTTSSSDTTLRNENPLTDWLFEPIVAYASDGSLTIDDPEPYYNVYKYDVISNCEDNDPYRAPTFEESSLVDAVRNINVPLGVDSIDVYGYINNYTTEGEAYKGADAATKSNTLNYQRYLRDSWNSDIRRMYNGSKVSDTDGSIIQPGLFSGSYKDFANSSDYEKFERGNDLIQTVTLNSVKYLPDYAFDSCEQLYSVNIGKDCADIGTAPFRGCYLLTSVSNNDYYTTDNLIIYSNNTDGSRTIEECLSARGWNGNGQGLIAIGTDPLLGEVSAIKKGAFEDCDYITNISFGVNDTAGLTEIPEDCFKNCNLLQQVTLPQTVNDIGRGAFVGANQLREFTVYGREVKISGNAFENNEDNPKCQTMVHAYNDSAVVRYVKEYGDVYDLVISPDALDDYWQVSFLDANFVLIEEPEDSDGNVLENPQNVKDGDKAVTPKPPTMEGWEFNDWVGMNGTKKDDRIHQNTIFYAQGYSTSGMVGGKYVVEFFDTDGTKLKTQYVEPGGDAEPPFVTPPDGFIFDTWKSDKNVPMTNIQSNVAFIASYKLINGGSSGGSTNTSGNGTNTSGSGTNTPGNNTTSNKTTSSSMSTSSSTTSSSNASTSTTSTTANASLYAVTVIGGSGSGSYAAGTTVVIQANTPAAGSVFQKWVTESQGVTFASVSTTPTTFVMPSNNVTITAEYTQAPAPATTPAATGGTSGGTATDNGNTRVDITKPGISNKDLATVNVNGSTDNFIIKITETDEATRAVADALTNKYGSLENILYYAMDISLWDSTGTYKLTSDQTAGLSVDITIPIPDALVAYGGNNMAGAVINGNQLENLNENFTTINGVPCIRFTATHFSPYTVYVDTGNLTEGMLDATPKTGDPIHPKWFLSVGLACLSIILFMKKDKASKVKTA